MPKNSDTRTVISDYWYTAEQISEVGQAWARAGSHRLFLLHEMSEESNTRLVDAVVAQVEHTRMQLGEEAALVLAQTLRANALGELMGRTGLEQAHVNALSTFPFSIMLPINRSNSHWTSIAIAISDDATDVRKKIVKISYSDSGSYSGDSIPSSVMDEMQRVAQLFRIKFGSENIAISAGAYPHAWHQPDSSSCGAYALKNAERSLAGKGAEENLGRQLIRKEQLDAMTNIVAIKKCSTNNEIDEILIHWMLDCLTKHTNYAIDSAEDIERICEAYATFKKIGIDIVREKFISEYGIFSSHLTRISRVIADSTSVHVDEIEAKFVAKYGLDKKNTLRHLPVVARMRELMQSNETLRATIPPGQYETQLNLLREASALQKFESIRTAIVKSAGEGVDSYNITADIIGYVVRMNIFEAVSKVAEFVTVPAEVNKCFTAIGEIIGSRGIETDYSLKLIHLSRAYRGISKSAKAINPQPPAIDTQLQRYGIKTISENAPRKLLDAQVTLLQAAIRRNDASFLMHVAYIINDFCSAITEVVTFGRWEPDFRRIEAIKEKLKSNPKNVTRKDYQKELRSIQSLCDAQDLLEDGDLDIGSPSADSP